MRRIFLDENSHLKMEYPLYPNFLQELVPYIRDPQLLHNLILLNKVSSEEVYKYINPEMALELLYQAVKLKKPRTILNLLRRFFYDPRIRSIVATWAHQQGEEEIVKFISSLGPWSEVPPNDLVVYTSNREWWLVRFMLLLNNITQDTLDDALLIATGYHGEEIVPLLVSAGANLQKENNTLVSNSIRTHNPPLLQLLINYGANIHFNRELPLLYAIHTNQPEIVKILIQAGANLHSDNDWPLMLAVKSNNFPIAQMLLEAGADPHAQNDLARTLAINNRNFEMTHLILKYMYPG